MSDKRLQEIITRAVVGRAERTLSWCHKLAASDMKQVLGVRVGKTSVEVDVKDGKSMAELTVDCDLWCSSGEETRVLRTRCRYAQEVPVSTRGEVLGDLDSRIHLVSGPRSTAVRLEGESIFMDFECTVHVEVTAMARLWVKTLDLDLAPVADDWDSSGLSQSYGSH